MYDPLNEQQAFHRGIPVEFHGSQLGERRITQRPPQPQYEHPELMEELALLKQQKEDLDQRFKDLEKENKRLDEITTPDGSHREILRLAMGDSHINARRTLAVDLICKILGRLKYNETAQEFRDLMTQS